MRERYNLDTDDLFKTMQQDFEETLTREQQFDLCGPKYMAAFQAWVHDRHTHGKERGERKGESR